MSAVCPLRHVGRCLLLLLVLLPGMLLAESVLAQSLEPRRWSHLPVNANFLGVGAGYSSGDVFVDPALRIEDGEVDLMFFGVTYIRSFEMLGRTARLEGSLPYANARWEGLLNGEPASTRRSGFVDPSIRFSINLVGSPALQGKAFREYRAASTRNTIIGAAIDLTIPMGEYDPTRLINLGNNRYVLRPQLGVLHQRGNWEFETTGSVLLYGENREFFRGQERKQDPLWFVQGHVIRRLERGKWLGMSAGFGFGGENTIGGEKKDDEGRVGFFAMSYGFPVGPAQSLKFTLASSETHTAKGTDLLTLLMAWSTAF